jgi:hypothetical protein
VLTKLVREPKGGQDLAFQLLMIQIRLSVNSNRRDQLFASLKVGVSDVRGLATRVCSPLLFNKTCTIAVDSILYSNTMQLIQ